MTTQLFAYGSATAYAITLTSLATDANLLAGRQSDFVSNTSTLADDYFFGGFITLGSSPVAGQIEIWLYGSWDGATYSGQGSGAGNGIITGSDATATFTAASGKNLLALATVIQTEAVTNRQYNFGPISVANSFAGVMPDRHGIFITHNTTVALNATGSNHVLKYRAINYTFS